MPAAQLMRFEIRVSAREDLEFDALYALYLAQERDGYCPQPLLRSLRTLVCAGIVV